MNASTATENGKKTVKKVISVVGITTILLMVANFLLRRTEVNPPGTLGDRFVYRVNKPSLKTDVYERETGRYIFTWNMDTGPIPRTIEKKTDGSWFITLGPEH